MGLIGRIQELFRRPVRIVRIEGMTQKELDEGIAVADTHPTYRAFMCLLAQALDEAQLRAEQDLALPRALEAHTGGAKYVRQVMEAVIRRRLRVMEERRKRAARTEGRR